MANKLSALKISKIVGYKYAGLSQHQVAKKLKINQSTVGHYWNEFDDCAKVEGIETATQIYGGGDLSELTALAAELHKENLSVPELKGALALYKLFEKLEVSPDDFERVIKACKKISEKGFVETAAELDELEDELGVSATEIIQNVKEAADELKKAHNELNQLYGLIKTTKNEAQAATNALSKHLTQVGLTHHRLELVEKLSLILKKAGISDEAIGTYLKRQAILDEANMDMALFVSMVTQAKMVTAIDGGEALLGALKKYGSLASVNASLEARQKTLQGLVGGWEQQAALMGKLEAKVAQLYAERIALEPYLEMLRSAKEQFEKLQVKIAETVESSNQVVEQTKQRLQEKDELEKCIVGLNEKTKDLVPKAKRVIELNAQITRLEAEMERREDEWQSFLGFVALVREQPLKGLEIFSGVLPHLIKNVKQGVYKAIPVRNQVVKELTGNEVPLPMCFTCVNNPVKMQQAIPKSILRIPIKTTTNEETSAS